MCEKNDLFIIYTKNFPIHIEYYHKFKPLPKNVVFYTKKNIYNVATNDPFPTVKVLISIRCHGKSAKSCVCFIRTTFQYKTNVYIFIPINDHIRERFAMLHDFATSFKVHDKITQFVDGVEKLQSY